LKELKPYNIHIINLQNKQYDFEFEETQSFFTALDQSFIENGAFKATIRLDKSETMIQLRFDISGVVELVCDRSLDTFDQPFETTQKLILKFGEVAEELTDEIEVIPRLLEDYNIAQSLFDFIYLALPTKKLHPRFSEEDPEDDDTEGKIIYSSAEANADKSEQETIDPRWAVLSKLKSTE
jgi:uncharacterized metal-binding protein YceD (DUF177 family)